MTRASSGLRADRGGSRLLRARRLPGAVAADVGRWRDALPAETSATACPRGSRTCGPRRRMPRSALSRTLLGVKTTSISDARFARFASPASTRRRSRIPISPCSATGTGATRGGRRRTGRALPAFTRRWAPRRPRPRPARDRDAGSGRSGRGAVLNLRHAITLDPENDEAKFNLELALQRAEACRSQRRRRSDPTPGGSGAEGAGAGDPGSGY